MLHAGKMPPYSIISRCHNAGLMPDDFMPHRNWHFCRCLQITTGVYI
jgi:hypothetical protein